MRCLVLAVILAAAAAPVAHAQDVVSIDADGEADTSNGDPRTAALDEAFGHAIASVLQDLLPQDVRTAHQADLDREIVGRARLWVAKFTVSKDTTAGDRRLLKVAVRVDRDKLIARLDELGISTKLVTVLLRISDVTGARATFGQGAEKDLPGVAALTTTLRAAGMQLKRASPTGAPARTDGAVPVSDDEAAALAKAANADVAAIAGVTVGAPVHVRGIATDAMSVTANLRLVERRGTKLVGQGTATSAAKGSEQVAKAIERVLVGAMTDVLPPVKKTLATGGQFAGADVPVTDPGVVLVRLAPMTPWGLVAAEVRYLQGAKGIKRAVLRRLSPSGWVIGVATSESVDRIAQIAKKSPTADTSVKVKVVSDIVELGITGMP